MDREIAPEVRRMRVIKRAATIVIAIAAAAFSVAATVEWLRPSVHRRDIQIARVVPGQASKVTSLIQQLSQVDIYLDAATNLPVAIDFNIQPRSPLVERTAVVSFSKAARMTSRLRRNE